MGSKWSLLALGLGAYLTFVIVSFPASAAYRWFGPPGLQLAAIEGSLWRGSAGYGSFAGLGFYDLNWELHPGALLTGRLSLSTEGRFADGFAVASVSASGSDVRLTNVRATTSLQNLKGLLPLGDTQGQVSLQLQTLEIVDGWPTSATGELSVGELSIVPFMPVGQSRVALGDYQARFTPQDAPGILGIVNDRGGPLELSGRISLMPDRSYRIDALIRPRPDASSELVQGVNFVTGAPNAQGQRSFEMSGSL